MKLRLILSLGICLSSMPVLAASVGDATAGRTKASACAACHGADGNATIPNYPKLAGQHASYLVKQLMAFKNGQRKNGIMQGQVATLNEQDMADIAAFYAKQKVSVGAASDEAKRTMGELVYRGGVETKGIAACMGCHGPNGIGNLPANFPSLTGQNEAYTAQALKDFRAGDNRGFDDKDDTGKMMHGVAKNMSDAEIEAVAHYIAGLH